MTEGTYRWLRSSPGVDYSFNRPDPTCLAQSGYRFAVRYVGTQSSGKSLTPSEAGRLRAAGVDLVAVYQTSAGFMAEGASGSAAALRAHEHAVECGMPPTRPIYFALDMDPKSVTGSGWLSVERFLSGAAAVLGHGRVGVYGGLGAIERLVPEHCAYGWQTYAWSGGRVSARAHLFQYRNGVTACGGVVDLCRSLASDFGQWSYSAPPLSREIDMSTIVLAPHPSSPRVDVLAIGTDKAVWHFWADTFEGLRDVQSPEHGEWLGGEAEHVDAKWTSDTRLSIIAHGANHDSWCKEWQEDHWTEWFEGPTGVRLRHS